MVTSKQLRIGHGDRTRKKSKTGNDAATKRLSLVMETDEERKPREKMVATPELMLALTKDVVSVGVVLSLKPILKSWQLCL